MGSSEKSVVTEDLNKPVEFYAVSINKLVIFCVCTFGLYQFYWHYKNWKAIRLQTGYKAVPGLRAFFLIFFTYGLFKWILESAYKNGYKKQSSAGSLTWFYILTLLASSKLPGYWWLVYFLSFYPIVILQKAINYNNIVLNPNNTINGKFSGWEIVILLIGGIFGLLALIGTFMPKQ